MRLPVAQERKPGDDVAVIKFDAVLLGEGRGDDAVALHAGEHPFRVAAGCIRIRAVFADRARLGGQGEHIRRKLPQDIPHLPRDGLVRRARGERGRKIGDVIDLTKRGEDQRAGVGQDPFSTGRDRPHGRGTGPARPIHRALVLADVADAVGKFDRLRIDPCVLADRQLAQLRLDGLLVHRLLPPACFLPLYPRRGERSSCQSITAFVAT